jgi:hypothetical protein
MLCGADSAIVLKREEEVQETLAESVGAYSYALVTGMHWGSWIGNTKN